MDTSELGSVLFAYTEIFGCAYSTVARIIHGILRYVYFG